MSGSQRKKRRGGLHLGRYGEILSVFVKYGFGDVVDSLNLSKYVPFNRRVTEKSSGVEAEKRISRWERIRFALGELGPTFIKLGQFLSNRPDLLPPELTAELSKLQDSAPSFPTDEALAILEQSLGQAPAEVFLELSQKPLASASIAQVHLGKLRNGMEVAVKIRRPRISQTVSTDMDILYNLAELVESRNARFRALKPTRLVIEFERMLQQELDFTNEASNIDRFRSDFRDDGSVLFPKVIHTLTSRQTLVTEYVHGFKVSDLEGLRRAGIDTVDLARRGAHAVLRQVFINGFYHADPHPGNILVRPDGRVCFLDFGAIGIIPPSLRRHLSVILYGVVKKDSERVVRVLSQLAESRIADPEQLEYDVTSFLEQYSLSSLSELNMGVVLRRFMSIISDHEIRIVPGFYILLKTLVALEALGRRLDPDFRMAEYLEPYVRKLLHEQPRLKYLPYDAFFTAMDLVDLTKNLPYEVQEIMRMVKAGELRIQYEHRGLEPMLARHDQLVNRLVFAIVLAALIIGSSLVVHAGVPPVVYGIPVIGLVGFVMAAVIGFGLIFSMLRQKRV